MVDETYTMGLRARGNIGSERAVARRAHDLDLRDVRPPQGNCGSRCSAQMACAPTSMDSRGAYGAAASRGVV
jgi:hypothetical protein